MSSKGIIVGRATLPPAALIVAATIFIFGSFGPNSLLAVLAAAVLFFGSWLLWRPAESPILLFVFGYQWLQASTEVFHANWQGLDVGALATYGGNVELATVLSLLGLLILALGMRLGAGPWRQQDSALVRSTASYYAPEYWFRLYAAAFLIATLAQSVAWVTPGLTQPLLALASLKWAFYWTLAYATFTQRGSTKFYWLSVFGLEIALSLGGYFADFRTPLIFTLLAAVAAGVRLSAGRYLGLLSLAALALTLAVAWTAVKGEYRSLVSGGERAQIVTLSYSERIERLGSMVAQLDGPAMVVATTQLLERLAYVDFFGLVLATVPSTMPHEKGALWLDAITRPFMPRLLFPQKAIIDDSERTSYYTGLDLAGADRGTSISIGYMGESYIDFGAVGMMVPIFALGLLLGGLYRWMVGFNPSSKLLGMVLASATIFGATFLESSITKVLGWLVVTTLVSWVVLRFIAPRYILGRGTKRYPQDVRPLGARRQGEV